MIFGIIVLIIAGVSVLLALNSLRGLNNKRDLEKAKKELEKGRVLYQGDQPSSGNAKSSSS